MVIDATGSLPAASSGANALTDPRDHLTADPGAPPDLLPGRPRGGRRRHGPPAGRDGRRVATRARAQDHAVRRACRRQPRARHRAARRRALADLRRRHAQGPSHWTANPAATARQMRSSGPWMDCDETAAARDLVRGLVERASELPVARSLSRRYSATTAARLPRSFRSSSVSSARSSCRDCCVTPRAAARATSLFVHGCGSPLAGQRRMAARPQRGWRWLEVG